MIPCNTIMGDDEKAAAGYRISVIIPVLYETSRINHAIEYIHAQDFRENYEVIVVDGDPEGGTIEVIKHEAVKSIVSPKGRARQMNAGAAMASGDILLFLHADTRLPDNALQKVSSVMEQEQYIAGAFDLETDSNNLAIRIIARTAIWRSRLTRIPYGDQAIFIQKNYFHKIGRYKDIPLMEDVELMQRIKKMGDSICILSDRVSASARRWEREGILSYSLRNMIILSLYYMGVSPDKLARYYGNRKNV